MRSNANEFLLDGAPNPVAVQNQPVINANPDTVQEFKVEINRASRTRPRCPIRDG